MAENSGIEWTSSTWTPIRARNKTTGKVGWHCEHASDGCRFCYSEVQINKRFGTGLPFKPGHRKDVDLFLDEKMLIAPLKWRGDRMIFVCSMTDLFADFVPDEWIDRMFVIMALARKHTFQILTKRAERMHAYMTSPETLKRVRDRKFYMARFDNDPTWPGWPMPNVWLGASAEDQENFDTRWTHLSKIPAAVRFVSYEPALAPITLGGARPDWLIQGGESGPGARMMDLQWARDLRDECAAKGVAYFFKQTTGKKPIPPDLMVRQFPTPRLLEAA